MAPSTSTAKVRTAPSACESSRLTGPATRVDSSQLYSRKFKFKKNVKAVPPLLCFKR